MKRKIGMLAGCLLLLAGCAAPVGPGALTLHGAIEQNGASSQAQIRATQSVAGGLLVYYIDGLSAPGTFPTAECVTFVRQDWLLLHADGVGCSGRPPNMPLGPFELTGSGSAGGLGAPTYSYVHGLIADPAVRSVAVTFANGQRVVTPVQDGTFLAVIPASSSPVEIEALDQGSVVVHRRKAP